MACGQGGCAFLAFEDYIEWIGSSYRWHVERGRGNCGLTCYTLSLGMVWN